MQFRLRAVYIDDLEMVPGYARLQRMLEEYGLTILMVDRSKQRFMDLHCYWID